MYPVGYRAKALPVGYRKVIVSGKPYFYAKGNYYRWLPKTATYVVVKNPGAAFG
ncbi:DUF6515 family protein [Microbulbifer elongatus]|uniref:DUF6515 family protein n=1 Tax=Microbulbifer elongatus TaxID=86173 RepID=UPI003899226C